MGTKVMVSENAGISMNVLEKLTIVTSMPLVTILVEAIIVPAMVHVVIIVHAITILLDGEVMVSNVTI